jgi:hypothetical protein
VISTFLLRGNAMFGSTTLDIVIGLAFIYLLLGLITSILVELIASALDLRAKYLQQGLRTLLTDPLLIDQFRRHPMINSLSIEGGLPSYIPARSFALAILGLVAGAEGEFGTVSDLRHALYSLPADGATGSLRRALLTLADDAGEDLDRLRYNIEFWYVSTMDRVSGLYKRRVQWTVFFIALGITVAANVDTGEVTKYIAKSAFLHDLLTSRATYRPDDAVERSLLRPSPYPSPVLQFNSLGVPTPTPYSSTGTQFNPSSGPTASPTPTASPGLTRVSPYMRELESPKSELESFYDANELNLPLGWSGRSQIRTPTALFSSLLGWLFTALAATICALFWFNILNRFIVIRSAVKPHEEELHEPARVKPPGR